MAGSNPEEQSGGNALQGLAKALSGIGDFIRRLAAALASLRTRKS